MDSRKRESTRSTRRRGLPTGSATRRRRNSVITESLHLAPSPIQAESNRSCLSDAHGRRSNARSAGRPTPRSEANSDRRRASRFISAAAVTSPSITSRLSDERSGLPGRLVQNSAKNSAELRMLGVHLSFPLQVAADLGRRRVGRLLVMCDGSQHNGRQHHQQLRSFLPVEPARLRHSILNLGMTRAQDAAEYPPCTACAAKHSAKAAQYAAQTASGTTEHSPKSVEHARVLSGC